MKRVIKTLAAIMLLAMVGFAAGCTPEEAPDNGGGSNGSGNGGQSGGDTDPYAYVDLGLTSGNLWATCNLGADKPEELGDYYAWGEIRPKDSYNWVTYRHCKGSNNQLTKYCSVASLGSDGFTDALTVLVPEDDAATANWSAVWSIPTVEQWVELYKETDRKWTTQNGVSGCLFKGKNGKSLFLPAGGSCWDGEVEYPEIGHYWSSSLSTSFPNQAWSLYVDSGSIGKSEYGRAYGFLVRPVRVAQH